MKTFQHISREYVPSVDLNVLGNMYNTLEKGHQEAVKLSSELKAQIANLPMNEMEDGFKNQLFNEIQQTIEDNTLYGNSYGALDDLVMKMGNIASDNRVIGRLRNQAEKEKYDAKVDSMKISEDMKDMFKEKNPYYYKDGKFNVNTGRFDSGEKWKPNSTPVNTVDLLSIGFNALKIASEESGNGERVTYLDANGKETPNRNESFDGSIYRVIGSSYKRLPKEKIERAYKLAINSINGADASLHQDWELGKWKHKKAVKDSKDGIVVMDGVTDKYGNVLDYDTWLNNKVTEFSKLASYNHVQTKSEYKTALENYMARQASNNPYMLGNGFNMPYDNKSVQQGGFKAGIIKVEGSNYGNTIRNKASSNREALTIIKKLDSDKFGNSDSISDIITELSKDKNNGVYGPNTLINYFYKNYNLSDSEKFDLQSSINSYYRSNQLLGQMNKSLNDIDKNVLLFQEEWNNKQFTDNNPISKNIIANLNKIYSDGDPEPMLVGNDIINAYLAKNNCNINDLRNRGFVIEKSDDDEYYKVLIPSHIRNELPSFMSDIREINSNIPGTIGGWLDKKFTRGVDSTNYFLPNIYYNTVTTNSANGPVSTRAEYFNVKNVFDKAIKAEEKLGVTNGYVDIPVSDDRSYMAGVLRQKLNNGAITRSDYDGLVKEADNRVLQYLRLGDLRNEELYIRDNNGVFDKISPEQANDYAQLISYCASKENGIDWCVTPTWKQQYGGKDYYKVSFEIPKDKEGPNGEKEGTTVSIIVSGRDVEPGFSPALDPKTIVSNKINFSKSTGSNIYFDNYVKGLGDTNLYINDEGYETNMFGVNTTVDEDTALQLGILYDSLNRLKQQYYYYANIGWFNDENNAELFLKSINKITGDYCNILNADDVQANFIQKQIYNYLNSEYNE